jgi:hypothetical protein
LGKETAWNVLGQFEPLILRRKPVMESGGITKPRELRHMGSVLTASEVR